MLFFSLLCLCILPALATSRAAPASWPDVEDSYYVQRLGEGDVSAYKPYTYYASAAYCPPAQINKWNCGANCRAIGHFEPTGTGGDGKNSLYWFVGYDSKLNMIILSRQGSFNPGGINEWFVMCCNDNMIISKSVASDHPHDLGVHTGFADYQEKTANEYPTQRVMVVGHSMGAAVALIDALYLKEAIPNLNVLYTGYGLPRVGNNMFAQWVQSKVSIKHINNKKDPVPITPPISGSYYYAHPEGEIHIGRRGTWYACWGQDNPDKRCSRGAVISTPTARLA
ncbi:alpha/beta-hydrolase [Rhodofomes roseus]|uniref:Alpha/beta-hydrolase n=1 Tax=Rhodofomes roseus TaxID=34475 RepID=A0ABQ8KPJ3_9APHY|nr:alpha/beta-hydrolase [Rhodofomes roseus]KAH9839826.1 alpha/beta-hydrolase [Rhodofomes roseus]